MSLCRYLPTPSDRMAAMWTLLGVSDAVILEYGPAGTTHYCMSFYGEMGLSPDNSLFTTHMSEDDVVMGDVTRLEQALRELDREYRPRLIFVVASSIASVIGTDVRGVCRYMQPELHARLVVIEGGGFRGDYTVGLRETYPALVEAMARPCDPRPGTYNVLGASAGAYRIESDLGELDRLLREGFGFSRIAALGARCTLAELEQLGAAQLNLVLRAEALPVARLLEEKFGTPYLYGVPYGYGGTGAWLEQVSARTGVPISEALRAELEARRPRVTEFRMYARMYRNRADRPGACIVADYDTALGLAGLCEELDIPAQTILCPHTLRDLESPDPRVRHPANERERLDILAGQRKKLLFADDISIHAAPADNTGVCVALPLVHHSQIATHLPLMGLRGADAIAEAIDVYYMSL